MKKLLLAVTLSAVSVNALADANPLDAIRDNLKGLYNDLSSNSWGASGSDAASTALGNFAQHTDELSQYDIQWVFGSGIKVVYNTDYSDTKIDDLTNALTDGVLTDVFGTKNQTDIGNNIASTDSFGRLTHKLGDSALIGSKLTTEYNALNDALDSGSYSTINTALSTFNTNMGSFNTKFSTNYWSDDISELKAIDDREDALAYGVFYNAARQQYISGSGDDMECFASYADYAKDNAVTCVDPDA